MRHIRPLAGSLAFAFVLSPVARSQSGPNLKPVFKNVVNFSESKKELKLTPPMMAILKKNLFVVTPGTFNQLFTIYGTNDYHNFPSIITTDNALQIFHVFFDSTLRHVEEHHLVYDTKRLTSSMLKQSTARYLKFKSTELGSAALKNIAYFGVANRLLGGSDSILPEAEKLVDQELASIKAAQGNSRSAIFPYDLDYSQFIVRGHYSRSEAQKQYFRAVMWLGLVPVAIESRTQNTVVPNPEQVRQIALMVQDLVDSGSMSTWNRIYATTSLYAGDSNSLTPKQVIAAVKPILGWPENLSLLRRDSVIPKLVAAIKRAAHLKIVLKRDRGTVASDVQFRLMGQRAIPDSIAFNRVTDVKNRPMPSSLDVAAVLGSSRASQILDKNPEIYNPQKWNRYVANRQHVVDLFESWPTSAWKSNLYNGSLDLIRLNLKEPSASSPRFMHSKAWRDKSIASSLAFWAELRHDTVLYGLQTGAEMGDGEEQPYVKGYVEPKILLYRRLRNVLAQMQNGLSRMGYLSSQEITKFYEFQELIEFLESVSKRELDGSRLKQVEHWRIRRLEGEMSVLNDQIQLIGENYQVLNDDDEDMAVVADVHTSNGKALTVATGHADDLIAIVPIEGHLYFARGSVLSYYEFLVPTSQRLSDHEWKKRVSAKKTPPRPTWIRSYFVNQSSRVKEH